MVNSKSSLNLHNFSTDSNPYTKYKDKDKSSKKTKNIQKPEFNSPRI